APIDRESVRESVREIITAVRTGGDAAALEQQERFGARPARLRVEQTEIEAARASCSPRLVGAIEAAAARVRAFHERQAAEERAPFWRTGSEDAWVGEETRAVGRAGCYVPGGRAAYPSTVLMTALPARIAGVSSIA